MARLPYRSGKSESPGDSLEMCVLTRVIFGLMEVRTTLGRGKKIEPDKELCVWLVGRDWIASF
jgi:hypothetical protein